MRSTSLRCEPEAALPRTRPAPRLDTLRDLTHTAFA